MKRACQRQTVGLPLPVCRWIAIVPTPSALSSTIRVSLQLRLGYSCVE
jgi:hypothetical protein